MGETTHSPNVVFASGAVLQPDGTITRVVEADPPRATPDPPAAASAVAEDDETDESPGAAASAVPAEPEQPEVAPPPVEATEEVERRPGESNRSFRRRLWEENQNYQARHAELLRSQAEREQRIAYLEGQFAALSQRPVEPQGQPSVPQPQSVPGLRSRPQPGQYADYQQYEDELRRYWKEQDAHEAALQQQQAQAQQAQERWTQRLEEGRLRYRDFDSRVRVLNDRTLNSGLIPLVVEAVMGSEHGADLHYLLATDQEAREAFNRLEPWAAVKWLAEAERRLAGSSRQARPAPARANGTAPPAPVPLEPVGTGPAQPVVGFVNGEPLATYEARRRRERGGRP